MLQVNGLTKYYGKTRGVHDLQFSVQPGEIFGLVGQNGAGKTTALRCVLDLVPKNGGEVLLNGHPFDRHTSKRKALIGYAPAEPALYGDMTVQELIRYHGAFYRHVDENRLGQIIRRLALDLSQKACALAREERKKAAIVLALMHQPKLLILDEATAGLDMMTREVVYAILDEERQRGTAILCATSDMGEAKRICDRLAIMRDGLIEMQDATENIVNGYIHQVTLECADQTLARRLGGVAIECEGDVIRFLYEGEADELIRALAGTHVRRLLIEEPALEDVFKNFYQ